MSDPSSILIRCRKLGLRLWAEGDRIGVAPTKKIPCGLLEEIRAAKPGLLSLVRDKKVALLTHDEIPWVHVARQVIDGEFEGADHSVRESLLIGLRSIVHPLTRQAAARLGANSPLQ